MRRGNERQDNTGKAITRLSHVDFTSSRHPHPCATHRPTSHRRPTHYNCRYSTTLRPGALAVSTISVAGLVRGLFATGFLVTVVFLLCGNDHLTPSIAAVAATAAPRTRRKSMARRIQRMDRNRGGGRTTMDDTDERIEGEVVYGIGFLSIWMMRH